MTSILMHCPRYPPDRGGAANYFAALRNRIGGDFECTVLTSYHPDKPLIAHTENGKVYRVIPRFGYLPRLLRLFLEPTIALLFSLALNRRINLIHTHSTSLSVLGISATSIITGTPIIYDCHDEGFPRWLVTLGNTKTWFSCAPNIDERLVESGVSSDDIVRLPVTNPKYVREYQPENLIEKHSSEGLKIIYVGRLNTDKGADVAVEAFLEITKNHSDVSLTIVGAGDLRPQLERQIQSQNALEEVNMMGELPHPDTVELIADNHVLLLPSKTEGIPRVIIEAFELGTVVLATPVGGIPSIVNHRENGLLIEKSSKEFSKIMEVLYQDKELRAFLARNAQHVTNQRHSWEVVEERVRQTYTETVNRCLEA